MPLVRRGLYYSMALVGILAIVVGASVRLRRPGGPRDAAFLLAHGGVFRRAGVHAERRCTTTWTISSTGRISSAAAALPPLFLHFAFVFPERAEPWAHCAAAGDAGSRWSTCRRSALGIVRALLMTGRLGIGRRVRRVSSWIETLSLVYLAVCLLGGLTVMVRALTRLRSVTARRQLRWIVWGSSLGALPFVAAVSACRSCSDTCRRGAEYTAVLLGCIPLAFASAIVRYRLMDIEVIIKKVLVARSPWSRSR